MLRKVLFLSLEIKQKVVVSILEITNQHGAIEGKTQTKHVKSPKKVGLKTKLVAIIIMMC